MASWIQKTDRWLPRQDKRKTVQVEEPPTETSEEEKVLPVVIFIKPKCPKCGNKDLRCNGVNGNIRYFKCACGHKFKAVEKSD